MKRIWIVIISLFVITGCQKKLSNTDVELKLKVSHIEKGSLLSKEELLDMVEFTNLVEGSEIVLNSELPNPNVVGNYPCEFEITYENEVVYKKIDIEVKDTTPPTFLRNFDAYVIDQSAFSLDNWVVVDEKSSFEYHRESLDGAKEKVTVVAQDEYGNQSETSFMIYYADDEKGPRFEGQHFGQVYGNKNTDVSKGYAMLVNKVYALPKDYVPTNLVQISSADNYYGSKLNIQLEHMTYQAFQELNDAMMQETGLARLTILSGYRSYAYQKQLYDNYAQAEGSFKADRYSARPGHSEHQTGFALDLATGNKYLDQFTDTPQAKWVFENAHRFGFVVRYQGTTESITGYKAESWHLRYLGKELAEEVVKSGLTYDEYYFLDAK